MNSKIEKSLRTIRNRRRTMALLTKAGELRVHEIGGSMCGRLLDSGWQWVGTYDGTATAEMVREDLGVVA